MRVLLVNGFPTSSPSGRERYEVFRQHVLRVMKELEREDVTQIDVLERGRQELDEFLFEMHTEFADPRAITNFDRLDFVFVVGDPHASPWAPALRRLLLLTKMCMMTGKCFYGSGLGAGLVAFLCSTAGERLRVLNNDGKGSLIDDIQAIPPPPAPLMGPPQSSSSAETAVLLDTRSGDFFAFDARARTWTPHGNMGLMFHSSDRARDYGARVNTARAGTKSHHRSELSHTLTVAKRGDTKCCVRLEATTSHPVLRGLGPSREFLVNCKSPWDLDEEINATGNNRYRVLIDSSRGPLLIEFGNCLGSHFTLAKEYPETCQLLRNFVRAKHEELRVHEHVDRSYVSALSGSARLKDRLQLAQTKSATGETTHRGTERHHGPAPAGMAVHSHPTTTTMTSGKTSPKRCRPVSAGPYRTASKVTAPIRTIKTSRSVYPSTTSASATDDRRDDPSGPPTIAFPAFAPTVLGSQRSRSGSSSNNNDNNQSNDNNSDPEHHLEHSRRPKSAAPRASLSGTTSMTPKGQGPEVDAPLSSSPDERRNLQPTTEHTPRVRRIRVAQEHERDKPYCAIDRFNRLRAQELAQHKELYYSVVNDAPYVSALERESLEQQKSKLRWMAGPFRAAVGKASTQVTPEPSIFTRAPFNEKNAPDHIIQRRQLEEPPPHSPPSRRVRSPTQPSSRPRTRPMSSSGRLPHRSHTER